MTAVSWRTRAGTLARNPLFHFVLIGALLFVGFNLRNGSEEQGSSTIEVDEGRVRWLAETFAVQFGHKPNQTELNSMINAYVTEEMSYREALALGLDQDDTIVRRRLIQKYDFLKLDEQPSTPSEGELKQFYQRNAAKYRTPQLVTLCQAYVLAVPDRSVAMVRVRALAQDLEQARVDVKTAGDPIEIPACLQDADQEELRRLFGAFFAQTMLKLPTGRWIAPVESGYGFHAVRVASRRDGPPISLEAGRERVLADWRRAASAKLRAERMAQLRSRYDIEIDSGAVAAQAGKQ